MNVPSITHPITRRAATIHAQYGHASAETLVRLIKHGYIPVESEWERDVLMKEIMELKYYLCPACLKGKQHRRVISNRHISDAKEILTCIMGDICGPIWVTKAGGTKRLLSRPKYALVLIDYYSRHVTVYMLDGKDKAAECIKEYVEYMERQTSQKVKRFHSDGGGEFLNADLRKWFAGRGIHQSATQVDSPFQNGVVERMNRSLMEITRCLLAHAGLPPTFWIDAYTYATYLRNRMIWSTAVDKSSHEIMWNEKPSIHHLPVFGCDAHVLIPDKDRSKLDNKSMLCLFVGVDQLRAHTYKVYHALTKTYYACADVKCDRESFTAPVTMTTSGAAGERGTVQRTLPLATQRNRQECLYDFYIGENDMQMVVSDEQLATGNPTTEHLSTTLKSYQEPDMFIDEHNNAMYDIEMEQQPSSTDHELYALDEIPLQSVNESYTGPHTRSMSNTIAKTPFTFDSRDVYTGSNELPIDQMLRLIQSDAPIAALAMSVGVSEMIENESEEDPKDYDEAMESAEAPHWLRAIEEELASHETNQTFKLMHRAAAGNQKVIPVKWVFKRKRGPNGEILRYKARLVVKGFHQQYGVDYIETHAPTLRIKSLRILLVLVVTFGLKLKQFDFDTAFLNATVSEDIYIEMPQGMKLLNDDDMNINVHLLICKLLKSLYGIKQAPHNWNKEIDSFMKALGFTPLLVDACVYHKRTRSNHFILVTLFVDDLLAAYTDQDEAEWNEYKQLIAQKYKIKDLGDCHWILNMKLDYNINGSERMISLSQEQHIRTLLKKTGMQDSHPTSVPMKQNPPTVNDCPGGKLDASMPNFNREWYQSVIGCLLFIATVTRPDITFAVNYLSRFSCNPGSEHVTQVKTVLRYLKGTATLPLKYTNKSSQSIANSVQVVAYGDADFAGDIDKRLSTTGWLVLLNGNPISWSSKRQSTVATSTLHAEYMAVYSTACEVKWLQHWFNEVYPSTKPVFKLHLPITIHCDNDAAIKLTDHDTNHDRTKHIDVKYHYVRELIEAGIVNVQWCSTKEQLADILTKPLPKQLHQKFRNLIFDFQE